MHRVLVPLLLSLTGCVVVSTEPPPPAGAPVPAGAFVENRGQWPAAVCFARRVAGAEAWLTSDALSVRVPLPGEPDHARGLVLRLRLTARPGVVPRGENPAPVRYAYFRGDASASPGAVPAYDSVVYDGVAEGVAVRVRVAGGGQLEYDVELAPGASSAGWQIEVDGVESLALDADGSLLLHTAAGIVRQRPAQTWQTERDGRRIAVPCRYEVRGTHAFGFGVERRDPSLATTIDPGLDWSTFLGGSSYEFAYCSAPAPSGGTVVTGETASSNFPVTAGAYDTTYNGFGAPSPDVFVTRFTSTGQLVYSTYIGGSNGDRPYGVVVTATGEAVVAGNTTSNDFPTTAGAWSRSMSGRSDGFVSRLSADGASLLASTFLGGNDGDVIQGIALDPQNRAVVAGVTSSSNYPITPGAYSSVGGGTSDAFATCLSLDASTLVWSSVFGGSSGDVAQAVTVGRDGGAVVAGVMSSNNFPTTPGVFQRVASGSSDGFVLRLTPTASGVVWATLLGGGSGDVIESVLTDAADRVIVGGVTSSNDFPTTPGAFSRTVNGSSDTFVTKLASDASHLVVSTVFGGSQGDVGKDIALDGSGAVVVGGQTSSGDFPVTPGAYQRQARGSADGYLVRVSPDFSSLLDATYLGGGGSDGGEGASVDSPRTATLVGVTGSSDYPVTPGAVRSTLSGTNDAFATRLQLTECADIAYGASSPVCRPPIRLGLARCARAGDAAFALVGSSAPVASAGVLILAGQSIPGLPIMGITLLVNPAPPAVTVPLSSDGDGNARLPLPLSGVPAGPRLFAQMIFVEPGACAGILAATPGLDFTIL